ncbi:uncharacterized protein LOC125669080 [Ostrea edulis]|uniref:uncharacterized protein LOC125669080 n=1 Tax=Ostrea edulis TaxID=37623 RepID=UPI0024AF9869|nr:uncharacterized protein LOC125669080 [Ostrea edulis]
MHFYSNSQVVLGYITNETRRFYVYVGNRVSRIRSSSNPDQWHYVPTDQNPADLATRGLKPFMLRDSLWLKRPSFLFQEGQSQKQDFNLIQPDSDQEIRPEVQNLKVTTAPTTGLDTKRFARFTDWRTLLTVIRLIKQVLRNMCSKTSSDRNQCNPFVSNEEAERVFLREVQKEAYGIEISLIQDGKPLPRYSTLLPLHPVLDHNGILRVGGRLKHCEIFHLLKQPVIIPKGHHIATLLVHHFHNKVVHQVDTFGPWDIVYRRTRGGKANQKRGALLFTCLVTRAVHIELIEELSSSSFINALRRFIAIRGPVQQFRSDRGTNFIGATQDLSITAKFAEDVTVKNYLSNNNVTWLFNPPHAYHMGGAWERLIGVSQRVLNAMFLQQRHKDISHEVLSTFMAEVTAIANSRPLIPISYDSDSPLLLTPSMLLTQKYRGSLPISRLWKERPFETSVETCTNLGRRVLAQVEDRVLASSSVSQKMGVRETKHDCWDTCFDER